MFKGTKKPYWILIERGKNDEQASDGIIKRYATEEEWNKAFDKLISK